MLIEVLRDGEPVLAEFGFVVGLDGELVEDAEHSELQLLSPSSAMLVLLPIALTGQSHWRI